MITLSRRQARTLRAVFRRHTLGICHKGQVSPLVLQTDPDAGLRVRHRQAHLAVDCLLEGPQESQKAIAPSLDALADFEGRDDVPVTLEASATGRTVARWADRGIPQTREYAVPAPEGLPGFPEPPAEFETGPAGLLDALAEAAATTDETSTRYALNCLQLQGDTSEVIATDGRQILIQGGFRFPWAGARLIRHSPLFAGKELPRDRPVSIGQTDSHVVLRVGPWTIFLTVQAEARFPRVEQVIPDGRFAATRLRLDPQDSAFLAQALDRLPGGDEPQAPVTLDLNGRVAVRARGPGQDRPTELVLDRSGYTGEPVRLSTNRAFLARALRLGFSEVCVSGPESPVICRLDRKSYIWQPLSRESAIEPADDVLRITSAPKAAESAIERVRPETPRRLRNRDRTPNGQAVGPDHPASTAPTGSQPPGLTGLIQEAETLHAVLGEARLRTARLVAALRRQRRQTKRMESAVATLRQLRLQDVESGG